MPAPGGIVAPPFAQPQQPAAPPPPTSSDPFAGAVHQAPEQHEVKIVFDERLVTDQEVGKKAQGRFYVILAVVAFFGIVMGYGLGRTMGERTLYNSAVNDGKDIYQAVRTAADVVGRAKRLIDETVTKARGAPGTPPAVDYGSIEELGRLEKPFEANAFARRRYKAFQPGTVDTLFGYYSNVQDLWARFEALNARVAGADRHRELDEAAQAAGEMATTLTGCVPAEIEGRIMCGLVFVTIPENAENNKVQVRTTRTSRQNFEKTLYTGGDLLNSPSDYVILTETGRSVGVLGQPASAFAEFNRDLLAIKALMDSTMEQQGQLETQLGEIARLEEVFAF